MVRPRRASHHGRRVPRGGAPPLRLGAPSAPGEPQVHGPETRGLSLKLTCLSTCKGLRRLSKTHPWDCHSPTPTHAPIHTPRQPSSECSRSGDTAASTQPRPDPQSSQPDTKQRIQSLTDAQQRLPDAWGRAGGGWVSGDRLGDPGTRQEPGLAQGHGRRASGGRRLGREGPQVAAGGREDEVGQRGHSAEGDPRSRAPP